MKFVLDNLESLLPESYQRYAPALVNVLDRFWNGLPAPRRERIIRAMAASRYGACAAAQLVVMMSHCPTLHKLGQLLARHRELDEVLRSRLQQLEMIRPTRVDERLLDTVSRYVATASSSGIALESMPIAEGSVASVVAGCWDAPPDPALRRFVVKVLKPGVRDWMDCELAIWSELGDFLDESCDRLDLPRIGYGQIFDRVGRMIRSELDLATERRNLEDAFDRYQDCRSIKVPKVLPLDTSSCLFMERIEGKTLADFDDLATSELAGAGRNILDAMVIRPFCDLHEKALFHGDPHAGNLIAMQDGCIGAIDWSLTARVDRETRAWMAQASLAYATHDVAWLCRCIEALSRSVARPWEMRQMLESHMAGQPVNMRFSWRGFMKALDRVIEHGVLFSDELLLLRKSIQMIDGVVTDLHSTRTVDEVMISLVAQQLMLEWPGRWFFPPTWRSPQTHLSNVELLQAGLNLPAVGLDLARQWMGAWLPR
ncbi:MAG: AarF/UbiB family protein [Planctomycetota bacterium]|jgi:ubiquinone biosynthesis protein